MEDIFGEEGQDPIVDNFEGEQEPDESQDLFDLVEDKSDAPSRLLARDFIRETLSDFTDEFEGLEDDDDAYKAKFHEIVARLGKEPQLDSEISTLKSKIKGLEDNNPGEIYRIAAIEYNEEQIRRGAKKLSEDELEAILLDDDGNLTPKAIQISGRAQGRYESKLLQLENEKKDFMKQAAEAPRRYQQEIKAKVSTYKAELAKHVEEFGVAGLPVKKENIERLERTIFLEAQKLAFSPNESQLFKTLKSNPAAMLELVVKYSNDPLAKQIRERAAKNGDIDAQTKVVKKLNKNLPNMAVRTGARKVQNLFDVIES